MESSPLNNSNEKIAKHYKKTLLNSFNKAIAMERFEKDDPDLIAYEKLRKSKHRTLISILFPTFIVSGLFKKKVLNKKLKAGSFAIMSFYPLILFTSSIIIHSFTYNNDFYEKTMDLAIKNESYLLEIDDYLQTIYQNYSKKDISENFTDSNL